MKPFTFLLAGPLVALMLGIGHAEAADNAFTGEIMDSSCAKMGSHAGMMKEHSGIKDAKTCTLGCVKNGASYVLYDATTTAVYELDDQQKPMAFAGEKVRVLGTVDKATNRIHVTDIQRQS